MAQNTVQSVKQRYRAALESKRAEIRAIEEKLKLLDELEAEVEIESRSARETQLPISGGIFESLGLTEAVLLAAGNVELIDGVATRGSVGKRLLEGGYKPNGKNFLVSVDTALRRLAESGKLTTKLENGRRTYNTMKAP